MSDQTERTFVMAKPDAVHRGHIGTIISRLEDRGLKLIAAKFIRIDQDRAHDHYAEHQGKPFFDELISFITSGPVMAMVWEGQDAVSQVRRMMGDTDPADADPGTIRGDFGLDLGRNLIHGSDTEPGSNVREIELFFDDSELIEYERNDESWLYE